MSLEKPVLYVCLDPEELEGNALSHVFGIYDKVIQQAIDLGWALTFSPDVTARVLFGIKPPPSERVPGLVSSVYATADALLVLGRPGPRQKAEVSDFRMTMSGGRNRPVFATDPYSIFPPGRRLEAAETFPWGEAAERRSIEGWACKSCHRLYGNGEHDERMARWCCSKTIPCGDCGKTFVEKFRSVCPECSERRAVERHAKRKRRPWTEGPVYSERDEKWFDDLGHALDHAVWCIQERRGEDCEPDDRLIREELEAMRVVLSEPVEGPTIELQDQLADVMADEDHDDRLNDVLDELAGPLDALNRAIKDHGPYSWDYTDVAVDLEASLVRISRSTRQALLEGEDA